MEQRTGKHGAKAHNDETQHAQGDDGGGDGGFHLMDTPRAKQLGHHHVAAHGQSRGHGYRQKHDGEGGAYGRHRVLAHKFSHHCRVHHVVQLLKQVACHHGQGKKEQQRQRLSFRQIFNHAPSLLVCIP